MFIYQMYVINFSISLSLFCFNPSLNVFSRLCCLLYGFVLPPQFSLFGFSSAVRPFSSNISLQQARITIKPVFLTSETSYWYTSSCLNALEGLNVVNKDAGRSWVSQLSYNNWRGNDIRDHGQRRAGTVCACMLFTNSVFTHSWGQKKRHM